MRTLKLLVAAFVVICATTASAQTADTKTSTTCPKAQSCCQKAQTCQKARTCPKETVSQEKPEMKGDTTKVRKGRRNCDGKAGCDTTKRFGRRNCERKAPQPAN